MIYNIQYNVVLCNNIVIIKGTFTYIDFVMIFVELNLVYLNIQMKKIIFHRVGQSLADFHQHLKSKHVCFFTFKIKDIYYYLRSKMQLIGYLLNVHTYTHTYIHTYTHTYIHIYIYIYIYIYILNYIKVKSDGNIILIISMNESNRLLEICITIKE